MPRDNVVASFTFAQRIPGLPGGFQFPARMTLLPLAEGKLALISPIPIDDVLAREIDALGEVSLLIAPNLLHHLYLGDATARYPRARVFSPRALAKKCPDLRIDGALEDALPEALRDAVDVIELDGVPLLHEFVFYHRSSRTLVVTDLVFNIVQPRGFWAHVVLFMMGCHGRLAQSRAVRFSVKDRAAASASVQRMLALPFDTLVVAHGETVTDDARAQLAQALGWLLPRRQALPSPRAER